MENLSRFVPVIENKFFISTTDFKNFKNGERVVFVAQKRREILGQNNLDVDVCYSSNNVTCGKCIVRPSCQNPAGN